MRDSKQYADLLVWFMSVQRYPASLFFSALSEGFEVSLTETHHWFNYFKR